MLLFSEMIDGCYISVMKFEVVSKEQYVHAVSSLSMGVIELNHTPLEPNNGGMHALPSAPCREVVVLIFFC